MPSATTLRNVSLIATIACLSALLAVPPGASAQGTFLRFNGLTEYVDVADNATLDITGAFTIEAMMFTEVVTFPGRNRIVSKNGTNSGYEFAVSNLAGTETLELILNQQVKVTADISAYLNEWVHVAATWDGSSWARLYINGTQEGVVGHSDAIVTNDLPFVIGLSANHSSSQGEYIAIDEVRVWSAELSGPTLSAWMDMTLNNTHPNWANLEANWRLNEGSGQTVASEVNAVSNEGQLGSSSGADGFDPDWVGGGVPDVQNTQMITIPTIQSFPGTALTVDLTSVSNGGDVTVEFYGTAPSNVTGVTGAVEPYSWVIEAPDGFSFGSDSELQFSVADIPGASIANPDNVVVYRRGSANIGTFDPVTTTWDSPNGNVEASGLTSFSEFIFAVVSNLPVELSSFDVTISGDEATLAWITASERENAGFEIELSQDDGPFERIDFVPGHGTTEEPQQYSHRVSDLEPGVSQFRLKQVDFDGSFSYSPVVEGIVEVPGDFVLEPAYPNPFNPATSIRFGVAHDQNVRVELFDYLGRSVRLLFDGELTADRVETFWIDAAGMPSGTYTVSFKGESFTTAEQITLVK